MKNKARQADRNEEIKIGYRLRKLRKQRGFSIRDLAEKSQLNVNTLSLIENGKTSPSVSTLQQIALALEVPITAFFVAPPDKSNVVFLKSGARLQGRFAHGTLDNLASGMGIRNFEPFLVTLEPGAGSGSELMVHSGLEFVFCVEGHISYSIEDKIYILDPGDSLLFEAKLQHQWLNPDPTPSRSLLILFSTEQISTPVEAHFSSVE